MISKKISAMIQEQRSHHIVTLFTRYVEWSIILLHEHENWPNYQQTRFVASTAAPFCKREATIFRSPYDTATWSGVFPS
jgi:hypothetical protein